MFFMQRNSHPVLTRQQETVLLQIFQADKLNPRKPPKDKITHRKASFPVKHRVLRLFSTVMILAAILGTAAFHGSRSSFWGLLGRKRFSSLSPKESHGGYSNLHMLFCKWRLEAPMSNFQVWHRRLTMQRKAPPPVPSPSRGRSSPCTVHPSLVLPLPSPCPPATSKPVLLVCGIGSVAAPPEHWGSVPMELGPVWAVEFSAVPEMCFM